MALVPFSRYYRVPNTGYRSNTAYFVLIATVIPMFIAVLQRYTLSCHFNWDTALGPALPTSSYAR